MDLAVWVLVIGLYWAPTITACVRHVPNVGSIAVLNFFGFTLVAWVVAAAMACRDVPEGGKPRRGVPGPPPGGWPRVTPGFEHALDRPRRPGRVS